MTGVMFYIRTQDGVTHSRLALTASAANGLAHPFPEILAWLARTYGSPVEAIRSEEWAEDEWRHFEISNSEEDE